VPLELWRVGRRLSAGVRAKRRSGAPARAPELIHSGGGRDDRHTVKWQKEKLTPTEGT